MRKADRVSIKGVSRRRLLQSDGRMPVKNSCSLDPNDKRLAANPLLSLGLFGRGRGSLGGLGLLGLALWGAFSSIVGLGGSPESEVVTEKLHDESGILVALLGKGIELGDGVVKRLLGKMASLIRGIEDLVVEHTEVQSETKTDGVRRCKVGLRDLGSSLVRLERLVGRSLALVANSKLGEVTMVITLHLVVEHLGLPALGRRDEVLVENVENVFADLGELIFNLLTVLLDEGNLGGVSLGLLLLLDRSDYSPGGTAGTDDVLVGDGEKVTLLDSQVAVLGGDNLHVLNHLFVALGLLGELGQINGIIVTHLGGLRSKKGEKGKE